MAVSWDRVSQGIQFVASYFIDPEPAVQRVHQLVEARAPSLNCTICFNAVFQLNDDQLTVIRPSYTHAGCASLVCNTCYNDPLLDKTTCSNCRQPIAPLNPNANNPPPPAPNFIVRLLQHGISLGARGLSYISRDVLLSLFVSAVLSAGAAGLFVLVDSAPIALLLEGPVLGAIAGAAFGAIAASAAAFIVFQVGNAVLQKVRWKPFMHRIITVVLTGLALFVAYKVALVVGTYLTSQWIASCVSLSQVSSVFDLAWKLAPMTTSLKAGLSSICVMTAVQVEAFGIVTTLALAAIWVKRALFEHLPQQWNAAHRA